MKSKKKRKAHKQQKTIIASIIIPGIALASSYALKHAFDFVYKKVKRKEPPRSTHLDNHAIGHVISWTLATSAIAGLVNLVARDILKNKFMPVEKY